MSYKDDNLKSAVMTVAVFISIFVAFFLYFSIN